MIKTGKTVIPANIVPWKHELRVAQILAKEGNTVEFLPTRSQKTANILLNRVEYEIKSPKTSSANTLEHLLKKGLRQCPNLIIDTSRTKMHDDKMCNFLISQMQKTKQIKKLIMVTKKGQVIDIFTLI